VEIEDVDWKMKRRVDTMIDLVKEQGNLWDKQANG